METRIRRTTVLFKELGYNLIPGEHLDALYSAGFEDLEDGLTAGMYIDKSCNFLEIAFTFVFPLSMAEFLKKNLFQISQICFEYGCYFSLQGNDAEINLTVFSKLYYTGMNYYSLRDTLNDFFGCIAIVQETSVLRPESPYIDLESPEKQDGQHEDP